MPIKRNTKTEESRKFWEGVDRTAARVDAWPAWMKGEAMADREHIETQLRRNGCTPDLATWLAELDERLRRLELERGAR